MKHVNDASRSDRPWHNATRFVNDFETIIAEYQAIGTEFEEETLIAKFLSMIDTETDGKDNPYVVFYNIVLSLPKEFRTITTVKNRFLNFSNKSKLTEKRKRDEDRGSNSGSNKNQRLKHHERTSTYCSSSKENKPPGRRSISELLAGKIKVTLEDLYSLDQRAKIAKLSPAEKAELRCEKCNVYFHKPSECPYGKKFCMNCYHFGHS